MKIQERYELICRLIDDNVISLGVFHTYDEAKQAGINQALVTQPDECIKSFQIMKVFVNTDVFTNI